jgi:hypothetical protein
MKLVAKLRQEFANVEELKDVMLSNKMYQYPKLYDLFSEGLESGKVRGLPARTKKAALHDMLSITYEAHFRLEISSALACQGYRHGYTKADLIERANLFKSIYKLVKQDRAANSSDAWNTRKTMLIARHGSLDDEESDEDIAANGGVDFDSDEF